MLSASVARAQTTAHSPFPIPDSPPSLEISLLTVGPGPIFWERFGHNAIVVRDSASGTAIAYNYGIFDFEQEHFLANFARGNMRYRIAADKLDDDIDMYREEQRSITGFINDAQGNPVVFSLQEKLFFRIRDDVIATIVVRGLYCCCSGT